MNKKFSKILSAILSVWPVCMLLSGGMSTVKAATLGSTIECVESGADLPNNVERGDCPFEWVMVSDDKCDVVNPTGGLYSVMYDLRYYSNGNSFKKTYYNSSNGCGENRSLLAKDTFKKSLEQTLTNARNNGTSLILRFSYAWDNTVGNEPSIIKPGDKTTYHNTEQIRQHIKEISGILNDYTDVVLAVECGMFGPWGEMHSSMYDIDTCNGYDPQYSNAIIDRWLEKLDKRIDVLVRAPKHLMGYYGFRDDADGFNEAVSNKTLDINPRLGMYNDGYLGDAHDIGTYANTNRWPYIKRENGVNYLEQVNAPFGGECAYVTAEEFAAGNSPMFGGKAFTEELYKSHLSYLHNINSQSSVVVVGELNKVDFEKDCLIDGLNEKDVAPYIGHSFRKFIRDHMGYRLLVTSSKMDTQVKKGDAFNMSGKIKNVGFGDFLRDKTTEIILKKGSTTKVIPVDFDANEITSLTEKDYNFKVSLPSDVSSGEWDVYMRIRNAEGLENTGIRFANPCDYDKTIYANKIGTVKVK